MSGIALLEDVVSDIVAARGNRERVSALLHRTVQERTRVMHERAQAAEGRALRAERRLSRLSTVVGLIPDEAQL